MARNTESDVAVVAEFPAELEEMINNIDAPVTADALEALAGSLGVDDTAVISPWRVVNKSELVNRPFYIRAWKFSNSDQFIGDFVIVYAVTYDSGEMVIFTDGSTGVCEQIRRVQESRGPEGVQGFLKVPNGLRESTYMIDSTGRPTRNADDKAGMGTTYYFG